VSHEVGGGKKDHLVYKVLKHAMCDLETARSGGNNLTLGIYQTSDSTGEFIHPETKRNQTKDHRTIKRRMLEQDGD